MPNIRALRKVDSYRTLLSELTTALKNKRGPTPEELKYNEEIRTWLSRSRDVDLKVEKVAQELGNGEAERMLRTHNATKPKRPKYSRRLDQMPRATEIESALVYELAVRGIGKMRPADRIQLMEKLIAVVHQRT